MFLGEHANKEDTAGSVAAAVPAGDKSLVEHQQIVAATHDEGSFFMTPEGTYVQLIHGVLRNVDVTPMMQVIELSCWSMRRKAQN